MGARGRRGAPTASSGPGGAICGRSPEEVLIGEEAGEEAGEEELLATGTQMDSRWPEEVLLAAAGPALRARVVVVHGGGAPVASLDRGLTAREPSAGTGEHVDGHVDHVRAGCARRCGLGPWAGEIDSP